MLKSCQNTSDFVMLKILSILFDSSLHFESVQGSQEQQQQQQQQQLSPSYDRSHYVTRGQKSDYYQRIHILSKAPLHYTESKF